MPTYSKQYAEQHNEQANESAPRIPKKQCCGSMTFWCGSGSGSGSADPSLLLMDPDPAIFVINLQDAKQKTNF